MSDVSRRTSASHDLEPESAAVVDWLTSNSFVLGANFHGGAVVASYPWDHYVVIQCTDKGAFIYYVTLFEEIFSPSSAAPPPFPLPLCDN